MSKLQFDVFDGVDPNGASIGTFTEAFGQWIRVPNNDLGEGGFTINRHSAEVALAATDNYVRVKRTGGAYVGAFWIETGQDSLVSPDEEGAEDYVRSGRGPLAYLERAILMPTETAAGPGTVGTDGNWSWTNRTIGAILDHIFSDVTSISPSGVPELTWDFDATNDSGGNPWDVIDDTFQLPIGMDILSVVSRFQSAGVTIRMDNDFTLHAWNDPPGADLSGTVSFVKGVNVRDAADRQVHASPAKTRVVVQGTTVAGTLKFRTVTSPAYTSGLETAIGVRYGFTQYGATPSNTMLDRAGRQLIKKLKRQKDGPSAIGVLNTPAPFTDYAPGDTVNVDIPGGLDDINVELAAIYLGDDESDGYLTTVEFEDAPYDPLEGMKTGSTSTSGSGGGLGGGGGSGSGSGSGASTCGDCGGCGCGPFDNAACPYTTFDDMNRTNGSAWGVTSSAAGTWVGIALNHPTLVDSIAPTRGSMRLSSTSVGSNNSGSGEERITGPGFWSTDEWKLRTSVHVVNTKVAGWFIQAGPFLVSWSRPSALLIVGNNGHNETVTMLPAVFDGMGFISVELRLAGSTLTAVVGGLQLSSTSPDPRGADDDLIFHFSTGDAGAPSGVGGGEIEFGPVDYATCVSVPSANQSVEEITTGDGVSTTGSTNYPYAPTSLQLVSRGTNVTGEVTETNPTTGAYSTANPMPAGELRRIYLGASPL